ncbi:hypothetical protein C8F04DRAFT_30832 [Mycena alexandri]|uniref:Pyridoxal phosphate homeostasis protein n=1 Tax=Mycena alexandri TaxID=1745969 RepID=A0AAD6TF47_9AGAR|nr:hypothetical protein C8F04DRAFT_30832 [Mycena alexandri]
MSSVTTNELAARSAEILESLTEIRSRVASSSATSNAATLVAVSKLKPASDVQACFSHGQLDFGENYVQELEDKAKVLPAEIRWHFIGTLQSNKAKTLAAIPNLYSIQTITSTKAATALNRSLPPDRPNPLNILIQINTSGEESKSGLAPLNASSAEVAQAEAMKLARHIITECPRLRFQGLMTIGALERSLSVGGENDENADFECLKGTRDVLAKALAAEFGVDKWGDEGTGRLLLSMGMSSDFEAALKAGSDIVRVGTGIFGARAKKVAR